MATLPIRIREIVGPDGTRVRALLVFCPRESASIAFDQCARCGFRCPPENGALAPAVGCGGDPRSDCDVPPDALLHGHYSAAARVPAGAASAQTVVCLRADTPLDIADSALGEPRRWMTPPVVDSHGVLLGVLPAHDGAARSPFLTVADAMVPTFAAIESEPLVALIDTMTSHHLRQVPIVDAAGRVTGTLADLDILRWVARGAPRGWR